MLSLKMGNRALSLCARLGIAVAQTMSADPVTRISDEAEISTTSSGKRLCETFCFFDKASIIVCIVFYNYTFVGTQSVQITLTIDLVSLP